MGNLPCAKVIIDNGYRLTQMMSCMNASILLAATEDVYPTEAQQDRFLSLSEPLAKLSAEIEAYVRTGGGTTGRIIGQSTNTSDIILGSDPVRIDIAMTESVSNSDNDNPSSVEPV